MCRLVDRHKRSHIFVFLRSFRLLIYSSSCTSFTQGLLLQDDKFSRWPRWHRANRVPRRTFCLFFCLFFFRAPFLRSSCSLIILEARKMYSTERERERTNGNWPLPRSAISILFQGLGEMHEQHRDTHTRVLLLCVVVRQRRHYELFINIYNIAGSMQKFFFRFFFFKRATKIVNTKIKFCHEIAAEVTCCNLMGNNDTCAEIRHSSFCFNFF